MTETYRIIHLAGFVKQTKRTKTSEFEARNLEALKTLENKYKVKTYTFADAVIKQLHKFTN